MVLKTIASERFGNHACAEPSRPPPEAGVSPREAAAMYAAVVSAGTGGGALTAGRAPYRDSGTLGAGTSPRDRKSVV